MITHNEIFIRKIKKFNNFYKKVWDFLKTVHETQSINISKVIFLLGRIALNITEYSTRKKFTERRLHTNDIIIYREIYLIIKNNNLKSKMDIETKEN